MASYSNTVSFQTAPDFAAEQQSIERQRKYAELLMQQRSMPQGKMVGQYYAAPSLGETIASQLMPLAAQYRAEKLDERSKALAAALQGKKEEWMGQMPKAGVQDVQTPHAYPMMDGEAPIPGLSDRSQVTSQPTAEDWIGWAMKGREIDPQGAQIALTAANTAMGREDRKLDREAQRQARIDQLQLTHQQRLDTLAAQNANAQQIAEANRQHQQAMARLQADLRPETLQPVLTPGSTTPVLLPRSQAVGMQPWNPAAAKTQQQIEDKEKGKQLVSDSVSELKQYYDVLKNNGGITSTQNGAATNLGAKIANSGAGQFGASVLGTESQKARESIAQARPLLMSAIKNATGMSAQQMNSNAELQFYMQAATDPSKGYEANMDALKRLDKMFGLGIMGKEEPAQPAAPATPKRIRYDAQGNPIK